MSNNNNIFSAVTNIDNTIYGIANENGTFTRAEVLVKMDQDPSLVKLYSFDLMTGATKVVRVNLGFGHCDVVAFVRDFIAYWYCLAADAINNKWSKFASIARDDLAEDDKIVYDCLVARRANIDKICKPFAGKKAPKACKTITNMVKAVFGAKVDQFSDDVISAFKPVEIEINRLNKLEIEDESALPNLKGLREALDGLTSVLWAESETCGAWRFHANASLTVDVYRLAYKGRKLGQDGLVKRNMVKGKAILAEVIFACMESLQAKNTTTTK